MSPNLEPPKDYDEINTDPLEGLRNSLPIKIYLALIVIVIVATTVIFVTRAEAQEPQSRSRSRVRVGTVPSTTRRSSSP